MNKKQTTIGITSLLITACIYGSMSFFSRLVGNAIPVFYLTVIRNLFMAMLLFLLVFGSKTWKKVRPQDWKWIASRSFLGIFGFAFYFICINALPVGLTYLTMYSGTVIGGFILGKLLFHENITPVKLMSLLLALLGLYIMYGRSFELSSFWYIVIAFIGGISSGAWNIFGKKISGAYPALQVNFLDSIFTALLNLLFSLIVREVWIVPSISTPWISNLIMGVLFIITGQLILYGFKYLEASIGSIILLAEILFAVLFGLILFQEAITLSIIGGGICIIVAMILPELQWKKKIVLAKVGGNAT